MTQPLQHPYVVFRPRPDDPVSGQPQHEDYLFEHPQHCGQLVTSSAFDNAYNHPPARFEQEVADMLAQEMNQREGVSPQDGWRALATYKDCPSCGRDLWANDLDVCYPQNRERSSWRVGCNCHDFGCGLEVHGDSYEDVVGQWNNLVLFADVGAQYVPATGRRHWEQEELLKNALFGASDVADDAFLQRVTAVSQDTQSTLCYAARHYLDMTQRRQNW